MYHFVLMMTLPAVGQAPQAPVPVAPVPPAAVVSTPAPGAIYYEAPSEHGFHAFFRKLFKKHDDVCGCGEVKSSAGHGWFKRHGDSEVIYSGAPVIGAPGTTAPPPVAPGARPAEPLPLPKDARPLEKEKKESEF